MDSNASNDTGAETPASPAPASVPAYRRFRRRRTDKVISGVCSGLGAYTRTDPVLWRLGFVVTAILTGGTMVLVYIAAAILIPYGDSDSESPYTPLNIDTHRWMGIGLLVLGIAILIGTFDRFSLGPLDGGFLWGLLLIGVGLALWNRGARHDLARATGPDVSHHSSDAPLAMSPAANRTDDLSRPVAPTAPPPPARRVRRDRSPLKRMTIGAIALAIGSLMLLDSVAVLDLTAGHYLAVALLVVGAGLLVGAFWGRARGLIWLGLVLTFFVAASAFTPVSLTHGVGERSFRPVSRADAGSGFKLGAGDMHVDLTHVTNVSVPIELGAGELTVELPPEAETRVRVRVAAGEIHLPPTGFEDGAFPAGGTRTSGLNLDRTVRLSGVEDGGRIDVDIRVGTGEVHVVRGAWTSRPDFAPPAQPEVFPEEVRG